MFLAPHDLRKPLVSSRGLTDLSHEGNGGEFTPVQLDLLRSLPEVSPSVLTLENELPDSPVIESEGQVVRTGLLSDAAKVKLVFGSLLRNAIKLTPPRSVIRGIVRLGQEMIGAVRGHGYGFHRHGRYHALLGATPSGILLPESANHPSGQPLSP